MRIFPFPVKWFYFLGLIVEEEDTVTSHEVISPHTLYMPSNKFRQADIPNAMRQWKNHS